MRNALLSLALPVVLFFVCFAGCQLEAPDLEARPSDPMQKAMLGPMDNLGAMDYLSNVKVYIDPSFPTAWRTAIEAGVRLWEGHGTPLQITITTDRTRADVEFHPDTWTGFPAPRTDVSDDDNMPWTDLDPGCQALSDWPYPDGRIGRWLSFNLDFEYAPGDPGNPTFEEKRRLAGHEFGHCLGFGHTLSWMGMPEEEKDARFVQNPVLGWDSIDWNDWDSIMLSGDALSGPPPNPYRMNVVSEREIKAMHILYGVFYCLETSTHASQTGIAGFDLSDLRDTIVPINLDSHYKDDLILYRPGTGTVVTAKYQSLFTYDSTTTTGGIAGYDLASGSDRLITCDYDGDDRSDIVIYRPGSSRFFIAKSNGNGTFTAAVNSTSGIPGMGISLNNAWDRLVSLDFDGNGAEDLLYYRPGTNNYKIIKSNRNGTFSTVNAGRPNNFDLTNASSRIVALDYNGDRKTDIILYKPGAGGFAMAWSNGNGTYSTAIASTSGICGWDLLNANDRIIALDYNKPRDGYDDILIYRPGYSQACVLLSNGTNTREALRAFTKPGTFGSSSTDCSNILGLSLMSSADRIVTMDFSEDGKDGVLCYSPQNGFASVAKSNYR